MAEFKSNPPDAMSLMTTARSFGNYDLAGALADLIDNSIKAQSSFIEITCQYNTGSPKIIIRDDGQGMTQKELHAAMRPASSNPEDKRSSDDLGRFGWGMKSASFSQCKKLSVISSKSNIVSGASWDLDDIDEWKMGIFDSNEANNIASKPFLTNSGTELIWEKCDRLSEYGMLSHDNFNSLIVYTGKKLSLIFHRYIAAENSKNLKITINGFELKENDPFHTAHDATQASDTEVIALSSGEKVTFQPFVLPHYSKLQKDEYEELGGEEGYVKNQGFYVYRNKRLIIHGTWFRLAKHGELSKLVRVKVDIPNTLDSMWKITVNKSDVQLPSILKKRLKDLIDNFKTPSIRAIRSKGGKLDKPGIVSAWKRYSKNNQIRFNINTDYPVINEFMQQLPNDKKIELQGIFDLIEQGLPVDSIVSDASSNPKHLNQSLANPEEFKTLLSSTVTNMLAAAGGNVSQLIENLKVTEPFSSNYKFVEEYLREIKLL